MGKTVKRLYEQFRPDHYELWLKPDRKSMTFTGRVTITGLKTGRPSQRLTFHQRDLKVTKATVLKHEKGSLEPIKVDRINLHGRQTEVRLHAKKMLYPGTYSVSLEFSGKITKAMNGMYPCYFKHNGQQKTLIATQFESHYAREVFPCIDEPEAKATFDFSLTTPAGETVLGNTEIKTQEQTGQELLTTFETTPRMSTYLLAFVYGEMQSVSRKTKDGILVTSWCSAAQDKSFLEYSVREAVQALEFFTDYFGVPYPLKKCDQVALPDFDAGAMENWGLITYREIALLADPVNRSITSEQYVSLVIAHELSHQWFGNLVTMKWWDDLWLNESFASLMEHLALDTMHPEWQQWETYTASDIVSTASRDVYSDVQPVGVEVTDPDLIDSLFDPGIVYAKGGRLLKMLREYIGPEVFAKGLQQYFQKHAYQNATRDDLWTALSAVSGKDIGALMTPWLTHPGMPVLEVRQTDKTVHLRQQRLLLDNVSDDYVWPVPLLADQSLKPELVRSAESTVKAPTDDYILLNQTGSGHYFVRYTDAKHRAALAVRLQQRSLPTEARINSLNDLYMLSRKGIAPLTDGLEIIEGCAAENRDNVWAAMSRMINAASQLTEGDDQAEALIKALRSRLAGKWFKSLGWDDQAKDDANTKQLRHTILAYMMAAEDLEVLKQALDRYAKATSLQTLPAELRSTILAVAVRHGQPAVVDRLLEEYPHASPDIQLDITAALASTKDPATAQRIYAAALGPKGFVRTQDLMRWLAVFLRNHHIRPVIWQYIVKHWAWIEKSLSVSKAFDYLPVYCASVITTEEGQKQYRDFFEPKKQLKTLERNISVGLADIAARVAWRKREETAITDWLKHLQ